MNNQKEKLNTYKESPFMYKILIMCIIVFFCTCSWVKEWWYYFHEVTIDVLFINQTNEEVLVRDENFSQCVMPIFIEPNDTSHFSRMYSWEAHSLGIGPDDEEMMSFKFSAYIAGESGKFNQLLLSKTVLPHFDTLVKTGSIPDIKETYYDTFFIQK